MRHRIHNAKKLTIATIFIASAIGFHAYAQTRNPKNSVGISYGALGFSANTFVSGVEQYLGASVEYRLMPKPWFGVQVQAAKFPQSTPQEDAVSGGPVFLANADILVGHRWKTIGIFAEVGAGRFHTDIFKGLNGPPSFYPVSASRNYVDFQTGGLVDLWLTRRWSLTFEVRDNLLFVPPYEALYLGSPNLFPGGTINPIEGSSGVAFHF